MPSSVKERVSRWMVLIVGLAAGTAMTVGFAGRAEAKPSDWIVFVATPPKVTTAQLFRIRPGGQGLKQITRGRYPSIAPAFSPDGKRIAFARSGLGLFTMDVDGSNLHRLTRNGRDSYPTWSPDGSKIAFVRPADKRFDLHVMSASGAGEHRLPKAPLAGRPTWNRRGLLVPSGGDLLRVDPATGKILEYLGAEIDAIWGLPQTTIAPDGSRLTFVGAREPNPGDTDCGEGPCQRFALYIEDLGKGTSPRLVSRDAGPAAFSADGKRVAFVAHGGIVVKTLATGSARRLKTGAAYPTVSTPPAWQPR